jgi:2-aminoadipate transaminase
MTSPNSTGSMLFADQARLSRNVTGTEGSLIEALFARTQAEPDIVSFAAGAPDSAVLPTELISQLASRALSRVGPRGIQYGDTQGSMALRRALEPTLLSRGIATEADRVHIATGGSGALHTLSMALLDPGSMVLVERPSYPQAIGAFRSFGADVVEVASDREGMLPAALSEALERYEPSFVYVLPTFQNPTGRVSGSTRRERIAAVVVAHDALLVEDDVYWDLRYFGEPEPAMWSLAPDNTCYITSLSKTVAPALRIGVAVLPRKLVEPINILKQGVDMQTSSLTQAIATEFLIDPKWPTHLTSLVSHYRRKLELLDSCLHEEFSESFQWERPDGGMFLWLQAPDGFDTTALLTRALDEGVAFLPGACFFVNPEDGRRSLRLSFAPPALDRIELGVRRLAKTFS